MSGVSDEDEGVNLLEVEDVAPYLVFSREEQGGYSLCGGVVDALVAYAASPSNQGQSRPALLCHHGNVKSVGLLAITLSRLACTYSGVFGAVVWNTIENQQIPCFICTCYAASPPTGTCEIHVCQMHLLYCSGGMGGLSS